MWNKHGSKENTLFSKWQLKQFIEQFNIVERGCEWRPSTRTSIKYLSPCIPWAEGTVGGLACALGPDQVSGYPRSSFHIGHGLPPSCLQRWGHRMIWRHSLSCSSKLPNCEGGQKSRGCSATPTVVEAGPAHSSAASHCQQAGVPRPETDLLVQIPDLLHAAEQDGTSVRI